jgi:hypothetical protein
MAFRDNLREILDFISMEQKKLVFCNILLMESIFA